MAYEIRYDRLQRAGYSGVKVKKKLTKRTICAILTCIILCMGLVLWNSEDFRTAIIPGNAEVTQTAWNEFFEDVKSGVPIIDAVTTFCRGVIYGEAPNIAGA